MKPPFGSRLYRILLRAHPREFRRRYGEEMARVFAEGLADARQRGGAALRRWLRRTAADLLISATRERLAAGDGTRLVLGFAVLASGGLVTYVDFHATEVQATLLVLLATNFGLGCAAPRRAWLRSLVVGAILPAAHLVALLADGSADGHLYASRLLILLPAAAAACSGAYAGVLVRLLWRNLPRSGGA